ncbi:MAG: hypothetical protein N2557_06350 [Hydrogenophilus sp.]|nr:hypothetical protein [Hydrogenophilus sp.]
MLLSRIIPRPLSDPLWQDFLRLLFSLYRGPSALPAFALSLTLTALTAALVFLNLALNRFYRTFFDALEARRIDELSPLIVTFILILVAIVAVTGLHLYLKRRWQLLWRTHLTHTLLAHWLSRGHHHRLRHLDHPADNPDARIAEDVRIATEVAIELYHSLLYSLLSIAVFADVLGTITADLGESPPGLMLWLSVAYATVGGTIGWLLGIPLTRATYRLQSAEADFRFRLTRCRNQSEPIALAGGETTERREAEHRFADLARAWSRQTLGYLGIVSYATGYGTLLPFFPLLVLAPSYIAGAITLGLLMQAAQAFERLTNALSWPVHNQGEIARCRASLERIAHLWQNLRALERCDALCPLDALCISSSTEEVLRVEQLTLLSPHQEILLKNYTAECPRGAWPRWNIPEAAARPLMKALAGLWSWGSGRIFIPHGETIRFLPARPYLPEGTLAAALLYPLPPSPPSPDQIKAVLTAVGLSNFRDKLDETDDWNRNLSLDKQRLLALARLLLLPAPWIVIEVLPHDETFLALTRTLLSRHNPIAGVILLTPFSWTTAPTPSPDAR